MVGGIYLYAVKQDVSESPMYGKSRLFGKYYEDCEKAVEAAKNLSMKYTNMYVEERQYASRRNVERDFTLCCHIVWASWLMD